jgi:hypothetical protein
MEAEELSERWNHPPALQNVISHSLNLQSRENILQKVLSNSMEPRTSEAGSRSEVKFFVSYGAIIRISFFYTDPQDRAHVKPSNVTLSKIHIFTFYYEKLRYVMR